MKCVWNVLLVGVLAGTSVNAACNDLTTAATCCGDNTCSWIPTCTDQATRCTSDAATDCPDEENDTANCANDTCIVRADWVQCCSDPNCVWFVYCTASGDDSICLDNSDTATCEFGGVEGCSCVANTNTATCCGEPNCVWYENCNAASDGDTKCLFNTDSSTCSQTPTDTCTPVVTDCTTFDSAVACCGGTDCQWFANCQTSSDGDAKCLPDTDSSTCSQTPTDTCPPAAADCTTFDSAVACCGGTDCQWFANCQTSSDGEEKCLEKTDSTTCSEAASDDCSAAAMIKVVTRVLMLSLMSVKLLI